MPKPLSSVKQNNMRGDGEKFLELYSEADSFAKRVSEFRQEVSIPAYNQLRYAGHHFAEAIASDSQSDYDERLREAVSQALAKRIELFDEGVVALKRLNANRDDLNRKQEKNLSKRRRFIITTVLSVGVFVILLLNLLVRLGVFE